MIKINNIIYPCWPCIKLNGFLFVPHSNSTLGSKFGQKKDNVMSHVWQLLKNSQYTNIIIRIKHFDVGVPALGLHRILITPNIGQIFCWISGKSNIEFSSEKMYLYLVFYKSAYKVIYVYNPSNNTEL